MDIGSKIRSYRKRKGLSLTDLSRMTGIAASNLSSIELNKSSPTLKTLIRIARAFNLKAGAFLDEALHEKVIFVRKGQGQEMGTTAPGHSVTALTDLVYPGILEAKIVALQPNSGPLLPADGNAERFVYCMHGKATARGQGQNYELRAGDSLYLASDTRVSFKNVSQREVSLLMVIAPAAAREGRH